MIGARKEVQPSRQQEYLQTLITVRDQYERAGLNPVFVGGVIAKATTLDVIPRMGFDHQRRIVHVPINVSTYTADRVDGTRDDFDVIVNHSDEGHVRRVVTETDTLLKWQGFTSHFVSTEPVRYAHWRPRRKLLQMVSGIDVDEDGDMHFTFGSLTSDKLDLQTVLPWQYQFEQDGQEVLRLPSFHPAFIGLRYIMRLPLAQHGGLRAKDTGIKTVELGDGTSRETTKFHTLMLLRQQALQAGREQGYEYDSSAWIEFIKYMQHPKHQDKLTHLKSDLMYLWWDRLAPIATAMAHGKGVFEEMAKLGNKFSG